LADVAFLVDCLDDDDRAVRAAAKAALERRAGKQIAFDVSLEGADRAAAIDRVRGSIEPTTRPAGPATARVVESK
jgi:hypothetical protein